MKLFKLVVTQLSVKIEQTEFMASLYLYIREHLPYKVHTDFSHCSIKCLWTTIRPKWLPRHISRKAIAVVYFPPLTSNQDMETFYNYFYYCIETLVLESTETAFIVTNDFNPNSNNFNKKHLETLCGLKQVIRILTGEGATSDLIFLILDLIQMLHPFTPIP